MDKILIDNWNSVIPKDGHVFHLGDIFLCHRDRAINILDKLNGHIYLIKGNHDKTALNIQNRFIWIENYYSLKIEDSSKRHGIQNIELFHYPILSWNKKHYDAWDLFGHCHTTVNPFIRQYLSQAKMLDVGVDGHNFCPWTYQEIDAYMSEKTGILNIDHHECDKENGI